jgi:hypothetical protein
MHEGWRTGQTPFSTFEGFIAPPLSHFWMGELLSNAFGCGCSNSSLRRRGRSSDSQSAEGALCKSGRPLSRPPGAG